MAATFAWSRIDGDRVDLEIVKDHQSDFYQWFYFRLTGARRPRRSTLRIAQLRRRGLSDRLGRIIAPACREDREEWRRVDTAYDGRRPDDRA